MLEVKRLIWDPGNVAHIARHGVTPEEVEQVCHGRHIVRRAYRGRVMLIGVTSLDRTLVIILDAAGRGMYYPVTARPANRRERQRYVEEKNNDDTTNA